MSEPLQRRIYGLVWILLIPLLFLHLFYRARKQPEYLRHVGERFGRYATGKAGGRIWIHAVSVGETRAAEPLMQALTKKDPSTRFVLTHTTPTGRAVVLDSSLAIERVYLPYDFGFAVRGFLNAFKPRAGILMETEVWPQLSFQCAQLEIPLALVNARLSARSLRRGLRFRTLLGAAIRRLKLVLAQTEADAGRLNTLAGIHPQIVGNLKFDQQVPEQQLQLGQRFRQQYGARSVFLCASTREGEEELLLDAWCAALVPHQAMLVIVPRHPQRFEEVGSAIAARNLIWQRRSDDRPLPASCQVVLGDSMGEMLAYYASATVAYVGGGLLPFGTHNLIEACAVGCPVIVGPHTFNFAEAARGALSAGAALSAPNAAGVVACALDILANSEVREKMALAAEGFARMHGGATDKSVAALCAALPISAATGY